MKKFVKDNLTTIVDNKDPRIADYIANGWREVSFTADGNPPTQATVMLKKSLNDVNKSEPKKGGKAGKARATDKKVNDAVKANTRAVTQRKPVDDGLIKKGAK